VQPARIAQRRLEKMKLLFGGPDRSRFEPDRHDRMFGPESFQMRLEEAEQNFDRAGRIGNLKAMFVARFVAEGKAEPDLPSDEIEGAEAQSKLIEEMMEDEKERLGRLDLVFELDFLGENFRWPNESKEPGRSSIGLFPECDCGRTEPRPEFIRGERGELAESVDSPAMEKGEDARNFRGALCHGVRWTLHASN